MKHPGRNKSPGAGERHEQPGRCRPGLGVPDIDAFHQRMVENNVRCVEPPKDSFGAKIAQYLDPDGLPISISESR